MSEPQYSPTNSERRDEVTLQGGLQLPPPATLDDFIGQERIKQRIRVAIKGAALRRSPLGHVLICGRHGLGKATLSRLIASELKVCTHTITSGPAPVRLPDLVGLLTNMQRGDALLCDGIQRVSAAVAENLCTAMSDFAINVVMGVGTRANSLHIEFQPFTLIGTTTRRDKVTAGLLSCFSAVESMEEYSVDELAAMARRFAQSLNYGLHADAALRIAHATDGTPLGVLRCLRHAHDFAILNHPSGTISQEIAAEALKMLSPADHTNTPFQGREAIPSVVRREVWRRDGGKCVQCGGRESLEYDHIIPVSKGGSNTARNIELLCEKCNRSKRDLIQ